MAGHRCFSRALVQSARFLKMPLTSQALYFQLGVSADDDGIVEAFPIMRMVGAAEDDLRVLITKNFVQVLNEELLVYITDWNIHNSIRKDRYHKSIYHDLLVKVLPADNQLTTTCQPIDNQLTTKCGLKLSKDKLSKGKLRKDICTEPLQSKSSVPPKSAEPTIISITLNDKTEYGVTQSMIDGWKELYPAVDILAQLRKMKGWCEANPTRRKTRRGIERFINGWLAKEQDKPQQTAAPQYPNRTFIPKPDYSQDVDIFGR